MEIPFGGVSIASCYMEGEVWEWFQDVEALGLCTNWVHFICALQDRFRAPILDASMETTTQESKMQESAIQVSVIQESKMKAPTILMILESNEVLSIQERSKVQRTNETLKIED